MRWHIREYALPITEGTIPSSSLSWADLLNADIQSNPKRLFTEATHHAFENPDAYAFFDGTYGNLEDISARAETYIQDSITMTDLAPRTRLSYATVSLAYLSIARFAITRRVAPPDEEPLVIIQPPTEELATSLRTLWSAIQTPRTSVRTAARQLPHIVEAARDERCFLPLTPPQSKPVDITQPQCMQAITKGDVNTIWQYVSGTLTSYGKTSE